MNLGQWRQGDLLVLRVAVGALPLDHRWTLGDSIRTTRDGLSGDAHLLRCDWMRWTRGRGSNVFALLTAPGTLEQADHRSIELPPGLYKFIPQREYDDLLVGADAWT